MKKILISVIIASGFAVSGDLAKCSEAMEQKNKYYRLALKDGKADVPLEKSWNTDLYILWRDVALKECKGILSDKSYKRFSDRFPKFFKKLKEKRERFAKEQKLKEEARKEQEPNQNPLEMVKEGAI